MQHLNEAFSIMVGGLVVVFAVMMLIAALTWASGLVFIALEKKQKEKERAEKERKEREKQEKKRARLKKKAEKEAAAAQKEKSESAVSKPADDSALKRQENRSDTPRAAAVKGGE